MGSIGLFFLMPTLTPTLLRTAIKMSGGEVEEITGVSLTPTELTVDTLRVAWTSDSGQKTSAVISGLKAEYSVGSLQAKKLTAVTIQRIDGVVTLVASKSSAEKTEAETRESLSELVSKFQVPFETLFIDDLRVHVSSDSQDLDVTTKVQYHEHEVTVSGDSSVRYHNKISPLFPGFEGTIVSDFRVNQNDAGLNATPISLVIEPLSIAALVTFPQSKLTLNRVTLSKDGLSSDFTSSGLVTVPKFSKDVGSSYTVEGKIHLLPDESIPTVFCAVHIPSLGFIFPLSTLEAQLEFRPDTKKGYLLAIQRFSTAVLGGTVSTKPFVYRIAGEQNVFTVLLQNLDLQYWTRFQQQIIKYQLLK